QTRKAIYAYAAERGMEQPGTFLDATLGTTTNWKEHLPIIEQKYTEYGGTYKQPPAAQPAMQASTRRGRVQCYCLSCKRKVAPTGSRVTGNRCSGKCHH
ncbi:MAG: hypothetical protein EBZ49_05255, partial [Proteobacteria bacterium]|nr:hypothetical protein [Pseudomonadota bacterium]